MNIQIANLFAPRTSAARVCTMRYPRQADRERWDVWLPALGPSAALFQWMRRQGQSETTWLQYRGLYLREQATNRQAIEAQDQILRLAEYDRPVVLLCTCQNPLRCHRSLLRDLLIERLPALAGRNKGETP